MVHMSVRFSTPVMSRSIEARTFPTKAMCPLPNRNIYLLIPESLPLLCVLSKGSLWTQIQNLASSSKSPCVINLWPLKVTVSFGNHHQP